MHNWLRLRINLMCFGGVMNGHTKLWFCQNRKKHIQNNRRAVYAFDRDLRPYTREGNMISERRYIYPKALDFSWIMAWVPEVTHTHTQARSRWLLRYIYFEQKQWKVWSPSLQTDLLFESRVVDLIPTTFHSRPSAGLNISNKTPP